MSVTNPVSASRKLTVLEGAVTGENGQKQEVSNTVLYVLGEQEHRRR